jgi:hypothetical protein
MPDKNHQSVWSFSIGAGKFIINKYHRDSENAKALWRFGAKKKPGYQHRCIAKHFKNGGGAGGKGFSRF